MKTKGNIRNSIIVTLLTVIILVIFYFIFNVYIFIIGTVALLILIPILYAFLDVYKDNNGDFKIHSIEYATCILNGIIIIAYNQFIVESERFQAMAANITKSGNISVQNVNLVSYIISVIIYVAVYYYSKKSFYNKSIVKK